MDEFGYMVFEEVWVEKEVEREMPPSPARPLRPVPAPKPLPKTSSSRGIAKFESVDADDDEEYVKKGKGKAKAKSDGGMLGCALLLACWRHLTVRDQSCRAFQSSLQMHDPEDLYTGSDATSHTLRSEHEDQGDTQGRGSYHNVFLWQEVGYTFKQQQKLRTHLFSLFENAVGSVLTLR